MWVKWISQKPICPTISEFHSRKSDKFVVCFVCARMWFCLCMYVVLFVHVCGFVCACMWFCLCIYVVLFLHVCGFVCACMWFFLCMYVVLFVHVSGFVCACMWFCLCMYVVLFVHVCGFLLGRKSTNSLERKKDQADLRIGGAWRKTAILRSILIFWWPDFDAVVKSVR